jgi:hypothetical protein
MKSSEEQAAIYQALAGARAAFGTVRKSKSATIHSPKGDYTYNYATLDECFEAIDKALSDHDLALVGGIEYGADGGLWVLTRLVHGSGQWIENSIYCGIPSSIKDAGSMITYARRYGVCLTVQIQAEDDDDRQQGAAVDEGARRTKTPRPSVPPVRQQTHAAGHENGAPTTGVGSKPTRDEVEALLRFLSKVYGSDALSWPKVVAVMPLPAGQVLTQLRAKVEMTRAQHDQLKADAEQYQREARGDDVDDVDDFSGPDPSTVPQDDTQVVGESSGGSAPDAFTQEDARADSGDIRDGPPPPTTGGASASMATVEQMDALKALAKDVSDQASDDLQELIDRHGGELRLNVYTGLWNRLKERHVSGTQGLKVY